MTTTCAPSPRPTPPVGAERPASDAMPTRVAAVLQLLRPDPGTEEDHRRIAEALAVLQGRCAALATPPSR